MIQQSAESGKAIRVISHSPHVPTLGIFECIGNIYSTGSNEQPYD